MRRVAFTYPAFVARAVADRPGQLERDGAVLARAAGPASHAHARARDGVPRVEDREADVRRHVAPQPPRPGDKRQARQQPAVVDRRLRALFRSGSSRARRACRRASRCCSGCCPAPSLGGVRRSPRPEEGPASVRARREQARTAQRLPHPGDPEAPVGGRRDRHGATRTAGSGRSAGRSRRRPARARFGLLPTGYATKKPPPARAASGVRPLIPLVIPPVPGMVAASPAGGSARRDAAGEHAAAWLLRTSTRRAWRPPPRRRRCSGCSRTGRSPSGNRGSATCGTVRNAPRFRAFPPRSAASRHSGAYRRRDRVGRTPDRRRGRCCPGRASTPAPPSAREECAHLVELLARGSWTGWRGRRHAARRVDDERGILEAVPSRPRSSRWRPGGRRP